MKKQKSKKLLIGIIVGTIFLLALATGYVVLNKGKTTISTFNLIPEKPSDFVAYMRDIRSGELTDLCQMDENYWKQPEFYPSWENAKPMFYDSPDYSRWGVHGNGAFPKEFGYEVTNMKAGDTINLCSFFYNGFGVWTYQGFKLVGRDNEYFDVEVTPENILMEPTFPVFEYGWVKRISLKITAKKDIPIGTYQVGYDATKPDSKEANQWRLEVLNKDVLNKELYIKKCIELLADEEKCIELINMREKKYVDGGGYQISEKLLNVIIEVKE